MTTVSDPLGDLIANSYKGVCAERDDLRERLTRCESALVDTLCELEMAEALIDEWRPIIAWVNEEQQ